MDLLMNGLLMAATLFAGGYCWVLARRVQDLKSLDRGLGGAIVTLTRQVELARTTLEEAQSSSRDTRQELGQLVARADGAAGQLSILLAAAPGRRRPLAAGACRRARPATPRAACPGAADAPDLGSRCDAGGAARRAPHMGEVPKPRALAPVENPLRRRERAAPCRAPRSEDEILEALTALAGGR